MAENVKKIYPNIQFFGVSCDSYEQVCEKYGVEGYPTLRFFKEDDDPTSLGIEREFDEVDARDESTPGKIALLVGVNSNELIGTEHTAKNEKKKLSDSKSNQKVGNPQSNENRHEQDDGDSSSNNRKRQYFQLYRAAKAKYNLKPEVIATSLRKDGSKDSYTRPVKHPSYGEMTKGMKQNTPGTTEFLDRKKAFQERIEKSRTKQKHWETTQDAENKKIPFTKDVTKPKWFRAKKMNEEEELILDTTLSLAVALESGLSMGITDITSKSAMKQWLNLLSVSLPPEWNVHKLIDTLKRNFEYATESKVNFKEILKSYPLARNGWSPSCQNALLNSAGFSCGFWKLIHVITLGIAEQCGGQNLIDSGMMVPTTVVFSPALAADTIRNYIDKFFTCKHCREHFLATYDDCQNNQRCERLISDKTNKNPSDWKELAMYFWEFHNGVSVRLVGERISRTYTQGAKNTPTAKDEVAVLFPDINNCIVCFEDDGTWNKAEVFGFLERTYWPDSEKDPLTDKLLKFDGGAKSGTGLLLLVGVLIAWLVYIRIGKQSFLIHQSLVAARQMVLRKTRTI